MKVSRKTSLLLPLCLQTLVQSHMMSVRQAFFPHFSSPPEALHPWMKTSALFQCQRNVLHPSLCMFSRLVISTSCVCQLNWNKQRNWKLSCTILSAVLVLQVYFVILSSFFSSSDIPLQLFWYLDHLQYLVDEFEWESILVFHTFFLGKGVGGMKYDNCYTNRGTPSYRWDNYHYPDTPIMWEEFLLNTWPEIPFFCQYCDRTNDRQCSCWGS